MRGELDLLASLVHLGASALHGYGVWRGVLPPRPAGALTALHVLGVLYNARRSQWEDAGAHCLGVLTAHGKSRSLHAAMAVYDGGAAIAHAIDTVGCLHG